MMRMKPAVASLLACAPLATAAADPVKHVGVYVQPYYEAAQSREGKPRVAVGRAFDERLASNRREDVAAVRDAIRADPQVITPMTLMVLAIRLYDVGLRDDAVFWFYAARDRYVTVAEVLDVRSPQLAQVEDAVRNFATLAGPVINGYAFCDLAKQRETRAKALDWVEKNPYRALFMEQLPARAGDRRTNLSAALEKLKGGARQEASYLANAENVKAFKAARKENAADEKFCWR